MRFFFFYNSDQEVCRSICSIRSFFVFCNFFFLVINNLTICCVSFFFTIQIKKSVETSVRFVSSSSFSSFSFSFSSFFSSFVSSISLHRFYSFDRRLQHLFLLHWYIISSRFCFVTSLCSRRCLVNVSIILSLCSAFSISFRRCHNNKKVMFIVCYTSHVNNDFKLSMQLFWKSSLASESAFLIMRFSELFITFYAFCSSYDSNSRSSEWKVLIYSSNR